MLQKQPITNHSVLMHRHFDSKESRVSESRANKDARNLRSRKTGSLTLVNGSGGSNVATFPKKPSHGVMAARKTSGGGMSERRSRVELSVVSCCLVSGDEASGGVGSPPSKVLNLEQYRQARREIRSAPSHSIPKDECVSDKSSLNANPAGELRSEAGVYLAQAAALLSDLGENERLLSWVLEDCAALLCGRCGDFSAPLADLAEISAMSRGSVTGLSSAENLHLPLPPDRL